MKVNIRRPDNPKRDRFILSKGHSSPALYATLAAKGYFKEEELESFRQIGSRLQGHPSINPQIGIDMTTGSLGQGLSVAVGMALSSKMDNANFSVFCLVGDGEIQEGQVWEAAMAASQFKLDNLYLIIDYNGLQIDGKVSDIIEIGDVCEKLISFGWNTREIDGHDYKQILDSFEDVKNTKGKPTAIIARTVKGKGVSFMENQLDWHGVAPNEDQKNMAIQELKG